MTDVEKRQDRSPVPQGWTYAPAPESTEIVELQDRYGFYVGGEWVAATEHFTTLSPRDETPLAEIGQASAADVETAVAAARDAFKTWSKLPGSERSKYLFRIARILAVRSREFAVLESLNGGKPIKESRDVDLPLPPRTSSTTPAGPTRSRDAPFRCGATSSPTPCDSRSGWSARSSPGTSRS